MKAKLIIEEDMRWHKDERTNLSIEGVLYHAVVEKVVVDSSTDHYEYDLTLERDWG